MSSKWSCHGACRCSPFIFCHRAADDKLCEAAIHKLHSTDDRQTCVYQDHSTKILISSTVVSSPCHIAIALLNVKNPRSDDTMRFIRPDNLHQILRFASCPSAYYEICQWIPRFPCKMQLLLLFNALFIPSCSFFNHSPIGFPCTLTPLKRQAINSELRNNKSSANNSQTVTYN